ncbi:MAG: phage protease [Bauldia sp.]
MTTGTAIAICSGQQLPAGPPDWIQLTPVGQITTVDGRGPYNLVSPARVASESLAATDRLLIDENHATDLAASKGASAPARGWIVALEPRADGIWGRVEWTISGAKLLADRAYRFISPVIAVTADGTIERVLRASLTNVPNIRGMAALNHLLAGADETPPLSDFERQLARRLGIPEAAFAVALAAGRANGSTNP